jgi:cell division protein FtsW
MASRSERGIVNDWLWTVDRPLLATIIFLMVAGIVFGLGASPAVAERLRLDSLHFTHRQVAYVILAIPVMLAVSFLNPRYVRRAALLLFTVTLCMVVATLFFGAETKGAKRWLNFPVMGTVQPSEFLKPAFVILAAWAFAEGAKRQGITGNVVAFGLLLITIGPLMLQPDVGQTMLVTVVWAGLLFLAGVHFIWVGGLLMLGSGLLVVAYKFYPHVAGRIDRFLHDKGSQDSFQVDTAMESFQQGGLLGKGPGEGTVKRILPDAHTDFIFAVTGEEFGVVVGLLVVGAFAMLVLRSFWLASRLSDPFARFASAGLAMLIGTQALINLMVNLHLVPPKGMTLPFISYGGSSMLGLAILAGFLLAVTRKRPGAAILSAPRTPPIVQGTPAHA